MTTGEDRSSLAGGLIRLGTQAVQRLGDRLTGEAQRIERLAGISKTQEVVAHGASEAVTGDATVTCVPSGTSRERTELAQRLRLQGVDRHSALQLAFLRSPWLEDVPILRDFSSLMDSIQGIAMRPELEGSPDRTLSLLVAMRECAVCFDAADYVEYIDSLIPPAPAHSTTQEQVDAQDVPSELQRALAVLCRDISTALTKLSERERLTLDSRVLTLDPPITLEVLGQRLGGVTRERARQVARRAEDVLEQCISSRASQVGELVRERLGDVTKLEAYSQLIRDTLVSEDEEFLVECQAAVLRFTSFAVHDGWVIHESQVERVRGLYSELVEGASLMGVISESDLAGLTPSPFKTEGARDEYLREATGLHRLEGRWIRSNSDRCRALASLELIGRPATKEELATFADVSPSRVSSYLSGLEGVCRATKDKWALEGWVDDPYDGIVGEIEQRIIEDGGRTTIARLVQELPERFDVSESSVLAYLGTPKFVLDGIYARLATDEELQGLVYESPSRTPGAVQIEDGRWGYRLELEARFFDGYSAGIPASVAYASGLRPGDSKLVSVEGLDTDVSVIWRTSNTTGRVDLGRLRLALETLNLSPGDEVIVVPGLDAVTILPPHDQSINSTPARPHGDGGDDVIDDILGEIFGE